MAMGMAIMFLLAVVSSGPQMLLQCLAMLDEIGSGSMSFAYLL